MNLLEQHARVLSELQSIQAAIQELTGLPSHWNGILRFETTEGEKGSKTFACDIVIRPDLASKPIRWRTLIHESFHACSVGYRFQDYNANIGWEEGVVEKLERLFRKRILERIGVEVDLAQFEAVDKNHPFDHYIDALEKIREKMDRRPDEFYPDLLATNIKDRYSSLVGIALGRPSRERADMLATLSAARPVLEGK